MTKLFNGLFGYYLPAFMLIHIDDNIDFQNFKAHSAEIKGTFMHEYCHYLQDVSTTYGFVNFRCIMRELMLKTFDNRTSEERNELNSNRSIFGLCKGDKNVEDTIFCINKITIEEDDVIDYAIVRYNGDKEFQFGNFCIAESMAYLVERRLYNTYERYDEFPYNVCEKICEQEYPEFAKNKIWVMALCELALLEMAGGVFFIRTLRLMKEKKFIPSSVREIERFIDQYFAIGFRGERNVLVELLKGIYPKCSIDFESMKVWIISRFELGCLYREESKCFISLNLSEENEERRFAYWQQIMNTFGTPIVISGKGEMVHGAYLGGVQIDIAYMLAPVALDQLLDNESRYKKEACPLAEICHFYIEDSCYSEICEMDPKKKTQEDMLCPLGLFWKLYSIIG